MAYRRVMLNQSKMKLKPDQTTQYLWDRPSYDEYQGW